MDDYKNYKSSKQEMAMGVGDDHYTEEDFENFKKIDGPPPPLCPDNGERDAQSGD